jgi:zinc transport system permease protein
MVIIAFMVTKYRTYLYVSLNQELAELSGIPTKWYQLFLYIVLAVATVLSIKVLGIVLVSALLIIPVSTAKLLARSARGLLWLSVLFSEIALLVGIILSLIFNLPVGSVIVLSATSLFILALFFKRT